MAKYQVILGACAASILAIGLAQAETFTSKSGNSTLTVTQTPGTNMKRSVVKTPDGQTVVQQSGGNSIVSTQKRGTDADDDEMDDMTCPDKAVKGKAKSAKASDMDDEDCPDAM